MTLAGLVACGSDESPPDGTAPPTTRPAEEARADAPILAADPDFEWPAGFLEEHAIRSPNAKLESHALALAEAQHVAAPGDGEGRAWVRSVEPIDEAAFGAWQRGAPVPVAPEAGPVPPPYPTVRVGDRHRFTVLYEVGAHGIAEGGRVFLHAEPFWEWSTAQTEHTRTSGFTTARLLEPDGGRLVADPERGGFRVEGRALRPGERIAFVYGAGPGGARVDRYADRAARILVATDADGDGFRRWVRASARVDVVAGPGRLLVAHGPAEVAPGEPIEIVVGLVDDEGSRAAWPENALEARFEIEVLPESTPGLAARSTQASVVSSATAPHRLGLTPRGAREGVLRLRVRGLGALEGAQVPVPPIVVRAASGPRLVWADLHGHTSLSDGTGTPEDYLDYARDIARLDVVAVTDHDHWGLFPLDESPETVAALFETIDRAERPGRFVTLPGYEWTSWLHGHRHVVYFDEPQRSDEPPPARPVFSSIDPATDRPDELWEALRGLPVLTFAHHTAGEPVATNWAFRPDAELEPVVEIASVHGQSESIDVDSAVRGGLRGAFALDVLMRGARLGFVGSGDSHDGHPGLAQIAAGRGGLAGLFVASLSRDGVRDALRQRSVFATNGIRPWLEVRLDETEMGGRFAALADPAETQTLRVRYEATSPLETVEIVRSGRVARVEVEPEEAWSLRLEREVPALRPGEFQYLRFLERNGGRAWSSPIFASPVEGDDEEAGADRRG